MSYELIEVTVLFLGTSIAGLLMGGSVLQRIKKSAARPLKSIEETIRAQAQLEGIAAAICKRVAMSALAPGNQAHSSGGARVPPSDARSRCALTPNGDFQSGTDKSLHPARQPAWCAVPQRVAGFTLPELLASLAVVAILAGLSIPAFTGLMLDTRVKSAAFDVYTTMVYTRSEAIKRNANVDIIPTGGNWKNGWTVQAGATVLKSVGPSTSGLDDITSPAVLSYRNDGRLTIPGTVTYVLGVSGNPNVTTRRVIVDTSGRPSIRQGLS